MKRELLEYLIRECVHEILTQVNEAGESPFGDDETKGAPAPPADGQGTADNMEIPKDEEKPEEEPSEKETPPPSADLKGVVFINPKDKSRLQKIAIRATDDAGVERELHTAAARVAGSKIKIALSTFRMVKDAVRNPNTVTYLYIGKYDPNSDEIFLMADKSLQVAKDSSISPAEMTGVPTPQPSTADLNPVRPPDYLKQKMWNGGATPRTGEIDEQLKRVVKKMIREVLTK